MKTQLMALTAAGLAVGMTAGTASGDVIASDDFSYADGSLVPNGGWANHSGTLGDLLVASGAAVVQHGAPSEDANLGFVAQTTGVLSASFDIVVSDDTLIAGGDYEYFAHFFTDGSFNFRSRLSVAPASGSGDYSIGISSTSSTEEATTVADFAYGDVVSVVLNFDLDTGIGSATAGGETIVGTSASLGESLDRFALRQSDSSNNETVTVDNLVIDGIVPEPASLALLGLGGLAMLRRRSA